MDIKKLFNQHLSITKITAFVLIHFIVVFLGSANLHSQNSTEQFIQSNDTLVVYKDVPGLLPSDKYTIRVRSIATNNEWVNVFAHYTYNRGFELADIAREDGSFLIPVIQGYQKHTKGWSHTFGNIEMNTGQPVEIEIAAKNGFKIGGQDFFKATVHPAQKASLATLVDGKIYFTISKPGQVVIDINGQMDDYNAAINPIGHPVHAISFFANPVIKKPSLTDPRVRVINTNTSLATINSINTDSYDIMYFEPGVHDIGSGIKIHPGKTIYIPGDAIIYGTLDNKDVPVGKYSYNGEDITIFGYGTISGAKIPHYQYAYNYPEISVTTDRVISIDNAVNYKISGISTIDNANHTTSFFSIGDRGTIKWLKTITWRANGDGIGDYGDVEDCFIRTADDCSYIKGNRRRCTFWKDANAALFHMATIPENRTIPLILEDCDVLYARLRSAVSYNGGGFQQRGEGTSGQRTVNVIIRNFRFHDKLINMPIISLDSGTSGSSYKGIKFQNISIGGMAPGNKQRILGSAISPWHGGVSFDNLTIGGTLITNQNYKDYFVTNEDLGHVRDIFFNSLQNFNLNLVNPSNGSITSNPNLDIYPNGTTVVLTATPKPGFEFAGWSGDVSGTTNPLEIVINSNKTVTAIFEKATRFIFETPGEGSWKVPNGIYSITLQAWGGGGAGGAASTTGAITSNTNIRGGGGAGGSFAGATIDVIPGQIINFSVGSGGIGALPGFLDLTAGEAGGTSIATTNGTTIILAKGGLGGINRSSKNINLSGSGGLAPISGNIGDLGKIFYGGNGGVGGPNGTGGGGGSAGSIANGGNSSNQNGGIAGDFGGAIGANGINLTSFGNKGANPGAGGSGGAVRMTSNTSIIHKSGGNGGNGKLIIEITYPELPIVSQISNDGTNTITEACEGSSISIIGSNFTGATNVSIDNIELSNVTVIDDSKVEALLPLGARIGKVALTTASGTGFSTDNLSVVANTNNTTTVTNFLSYKWANNGQTYTSSGIKTGTTTNCVTELLDLTITTTQIPTTFPSFCKGATVATATGATSMKFYSTLTGGLPLAGTTTLSNARTYFVTEEINGVETAPRIPKLIIVNPTPSTPASMTTTDTVLCKYVGTTNTVTYTVATVTTATSYLWSVPAGANVIEDGNATDNEITLNFLNAPINNITVGGLGTISARAVNPEGCPSLPRSLVLTAKLPTAPASLTMTSTDSTDHFNYRNPTTLSFTLEGLDVLSKITKVGPYIGTQTVFTLTAAAAPTAASYEWTLPSGVNQLSGTTSNEIKVNFAGVPAGIGSLPIVVKSVGGCGNSNARILTLGRVVPGAPSALTLTNSSQPYLSSLSKITKVGPYTGTNTRFTLTATPFLTQGATSTSYAWILPAGVTCETTSTPTTVFQRVAVPTTIENPTGFEIQSFDAIETPTNIITVNFLAATGTGNLELKVFGLNGAGNSIARKLVLARALPTAPTTLVLRDAATVVNRVSPYIGESTSLTLTATPYLTQGAEATSYKWTLPAGVNVTSGATLVSNNVTTTTWTSTGTVLTIDFEGVDTGIFTFPLSVQAVNGAGTSATTRTLTVISAVPAIPGSITTPTLAIPTYNPACPGTTTITVQVPNVFGVTYAWTVGGTEAVITAGQGTNLITIDVEAVTTTTLAISVIGSNGTGSSAKKGLTIKKAASCREELSFAIANEFSVIAYPNPTSSEFTIKSSEKGAMNVKVYDIQGRLVEKTNTDKIGLKLAAGTYNVIVKQGTNTKSIRVIKK